MKNLLLVLITCFIAGSTLAQTWKKVYDDFTNVSGDNNYELKHAVVINGDFYIVTKNVTYNQNELIKVSAAGDYLWSKIIDFEVEQIVASTNDDLLIAGWYVTNEIDTVINPSNTIYLAKGILSKVNSEGNDLWRKVYALQANYSTNIAGVGIADNGNLLLSAGVYNQSTFFTNGIASYCLLTDSLGNIQKQSQLSSTGGISGIIPAGNSVFILNAPSIQSNYLLVYKVDYSGDTLWSDDLNNNLPNNPRPSYFPTNDGGVIFSNGVKIDSMANVEWTNGITGDRVVQMPNGEYLSLNTEIDSSLSLPGSLGTRLTIYNWSNGGSLNWKKYYSVTDTFTRTYGKVILPLPSGFFAGGYAQRGGQSIKMLLLKADNSGNISIPLDTVISGTWAQTSISANNIDATYNNNGAFFTDLENAGFRVPKNDTLPKHTIYRSSFWIGGLNTMGNLHLAASMYNQAGSEYSPGPIGYNFQETLKWNHIWKVTKAEIDAFKADLRDGTIDDPIPASILEWPGKGNTMAKGKNGTSLNVTQEAAPYHDYNLNGKYDPQNGDYPFISGDEMHWFVFNDSTNLINKESGGKIMGIEIQTSIFAYSDPNDTALYNTVFTRLKFVNRSGRNYQDVYIGNMVDFDIGCFNDDYVGSDPTRDMFFGYNALAQDNTCATNGYGIDPPVQTVRFLNQDLNSFMYYDNDFTVTGNPEEATDFYNYMQHAWKDSTQVTFGGNGYGGITPAEHMFPHDPNDPNGWNEPALNNTPADRRGIGATGPYALNVGDNIELTVAYSFNTSVKDSVNQIYPSFNLVFEENDSAITRHWVEDTSRVEPTDSTATGISDMVELDGLNIYPNPNTGKFTLSLPSSAESGVIEIYNSVGQLVMMEEIKPTANGVIELSLKESKPGLYLIRFTSHHQIYNGKVIINP